MCLGICMCVYMCMFVGICTVRPISFCAPPPCWVLMLAAMQLFTEVKLAETLKTKVVGYGTRIKTVRVFPPSIWRSEALKTQPLTPFKGPQNPCPSPCTKKIVFVVGDLCEELGFGLALGSNLIIYVLKQATNHWLPSQGSRDLGHSPIGSKRTIF